MEHIVKGKKRVYTVSEIEEILGVSEMTVYRLVRKNLFRSVRIGGAVRISKDSFDKWLMKQIGEKK